MAKQFRETVSLGPRSIKQARKSLHQALIQIISPKVLQTSTTILQLKVYISYVVQKLVGHPPLHECPSNLASFAFPFVWTYFQKLGSVFFLTLWCETSWEIFWIISFFYFFPMKFHIIKYEKRQIPIFENKFRLAWLGGIKGP